MLDCQLYGLRPWGHHLTNLLLHTANTILVFLLFQSMSRATGRSFVLAALFGLHPLRAQSVAWVAERKDVLSAFFFLLTLLAYVRYVRSFPDTSKQSQETDEPRKVKAACSLPTNGAQRSTIWYALTLLFFSFGLMCKPMLVTGPFALWLLDCWPLGRVQISSIKSLLSSTSEVLSEKIPFFILAGAACVVTFFAQKSGGAIVQGVPFGLRLGNAMVTYWRYLGKLFWPSNLCIFYPFPDSPWPMSLVIAASALLLAASLFMIVLGIRHAYLPFGWFWFIGTLVPVIGLVQVGSQSMADRYTYIPSIGILVILVWVISDRLREWPCGRTALIALAGAAIFGGLVATRTELAYWQDGETLFRRALTVTTPNCIALDSLGQELLAKKRQPEAMVLFGQAVRLSPDYTPARVDLGIALLRSDRLDEAMSQFQQALKADPDDMGAHKGLGTVWFRQGRLDQAIDEYQKALKATPGDEETHRDLAIAFAKAEHWAEAATEYEQALKLDPSQAPSRIGLGWALFRTGKVREATREYETALRLDPRNADAHSQLGQLLTLQGDPDSAIREFQEAIELNPNFAQTHYFLGGLLAERGQLEKAIVQFRAALRIQPDYAQVQNDLGLALDAKGELIEAISHFREAVRLTPVNPEIHNSLGVSLCKAGKTDEGIAEFREALKLNPGHQAAQKNLETALASKTAEKKP
jgi:tetratricopeptide (TPR) repeat protein